MFPIFEKYPTNNPHPFSNDRTYIRTSAAHKRVKYKSKNCKKKRRENYIFYFQAHTRNLEWCQQTHIGTRKYSHTNMTPVKKYILYKP